MIFSEISEIVVNQQIDVFNNAIIDFLPYTSSPVIQDLMGFITELGSIWFIIVASIFIVLYLWFKKRNKLGILFLIISVGGGGLIIAVLKRYYQIDRPSINQQIDVGGYSFPSGHAMGSLIFYGFIVYLILRSKLSKTKKKVYSVVLILLIILIATSRIYLGVHFPSDVIAGQAGGLAWLLVCIISLEVVKMKTCNEFKPLKIIKNLFEN
ncbi:MAG: phosphatase PAP2 family protein [Bacillota bacterium]